MATLTYTDRNCKVPPLVSTNALHVYIYTHTRAHTHSMARIPQVAQGDVPAYCWLTTHEEDDGGEALRFAVRSCPGREKFREAPPEMEHCSGRIHPESRQMLLETVEGGEGSTAQAVTRVRPGLRHEAFGHLAPLELADLGKEGLRALVAAHTEERFGSKDKFYGSYCQEVRGWLGIDGWMD